MENRVAQLESAMQTLLTQFLPPVNTAIAGLRSDLEALRQKVAALEGAATLAVPSNPEPGPRKRRPMTYQAYCLVQKLLAQGLTEKEIAQQTDIPYTTVRVYSSMPQERVDVLRQKEGELAAVATAASVSAAVERGDYAADQSKQAQAAPPPVVPEAAPATAVPAASALAPIDAPRSPAPYGDVGWYEWTMDDKEKARTVPDYRPCPAHFILSVMYMSGEIEREVLARAVDWANGGVARWKPSQS